MAMTIPEMLTRCIDLYEQGNDRPRALMAIEHTLHEIQNELHRERPGLDIDRLLGTEENAHA